MKVVVRMKCERSGGVDRQAVSFRATNYHDAYEQALDAVPDGWELVSVKSQE